MARRRRGLDETMTGRVSTDTGYGRAADAEAGD